MGITFPLGGVLPDQHKQHQAATFEYGLYIKTILVTGANGQLGQEMRKQAVLHPDFRWLFTDIGELDLSDAEGVLDFCRTERPAYIINCAAYTAVDKAEEDAAGAFLVNRDAVAHLAKAAAQTEAILLHVSTDYVFDGTATQPYKESDPVCPATVYGQSKLAGEETLQRLCPRSVIVRTAWLYSAYGTNFVKTMLRLGRERDSLNVVNDQIGSPTFAGDLAATLMHIVLKSEAGQFIPGIYHYSNEGVCSWYDFTLKIHALAGITTCAVTPVSSDQYPSRTPRPAYSVLDKTKIKADYALSIPRWETSLAECLNDLLNQPA